jgi:hypothetical protein
MTPEEFAGYFKQHDDEFLKFGLVENRRSSRRDLHAFLLLDELLPLRGEFDGDIVSGAGHDQIWLDIDVTRLAEVITEDQIIELLRSGVMFDDHDDGLSMYA